MTRTCSEVTKCRICNIKGHPDALHIEQTNPSIGYDGERSQSHLSNLNATHCGEHSHRFHPQARSFTDRRSTTQINSICTQICGEGFIVVMC